ncbi:DODA-type extradiol aromatic ring-opening family dioxygenase [Beijerinckia indica]|uniref:Extradiol ring-cleavage dioxygenase class III protein subunit B n=1 Tax=Beijerinckia indica subsp. indica (strain ATCC 9039 / DSM 1715 / NCIMB 8712) TaxID=395963 RepID=B2ICG4_BEII9|nr:class III extradiol ring-cleavage dioxygenase [Beijerinckia indica]ACB93853.1 Extradiol ring-cleavage dioxygenase class III protein subunit B [Beijerinckia indica subsp. indica ATCC 9039]
MNKPACQPTFFIPHGGGPCFFMDDPAGTWTQMAAFLRGLPKTLPEPPRAILVISGHWETQGFATTDSAKPDLLFDYYNFPPHTYELRYPAPGAPALAEKVADLLKQQGYQTTLDKTRGLDHGVFIPLKVAFPEADIPVVELSLDKGLDPALHLAVGHALAPLRDEGVLILGAGMSFHNMRGYGDPKFTQPSQAFDQWLLETVTAPADRRAEQLTHWAEAPAARLSHPREEHLLPLMVVAGASDKPGTRVYSETVMETALSGFRFD